MARDYNKTIRVNNAYAWELKPAKFGRRTYLLIDNTSASPIKFDHGVAPDTNNGTTIAAGVRYERDQDCPQSTIFIKGTIAGDQFVNVAEGFVD